MAKKRGNGEGSIYRRMDGRWVGQYLVHTAKGPKYRYLYGKTRAMVAEKLTKAMADRDSGLIFDAGNLTTGEFLSRWLEASVKGNVRHRTLDNYRMHVRLHIAPSLGRIKLQALSPAHVQSLYRAKLDSGLAPSTLRYTHAVLNRALKQAMRWGLVPRNAAQSADPPKLERVEMRTLSPAEARRLLATSRDDGLEAFYVMAVHTGLRIGELLGLRWGDVDLDAGKMQVVRQLQRVRGGGGSSSPPPKTQAVGLSG